MSRSTHFGAALGQPDGWRSTLVYGLAHCGKSLFWYASELLFAFFLTEVMGLSGLTMGLLLALGLACSAVLDPVVGCLMRRADITGAVRLQLIGATLSAIALVAFFMGAWMPAGKRVMYALTTGLAFRVAYALYDVPQNALVSLGTADATARTRVTATRSAFSGVAALAIAAAIGPLASAQAASTGGGPTLLRLAFVLSLGAVITAGMLVAVAGSTHRGGDEPHPSAAGRLRVSLPQDFRVPLLLIFTVSTPSMFTRAAEPAWYGR